MAAQNPDIQSKFLEALIYGENFKALVYDPIPYAVGQLKFSIKRDRTGLNKLEPLFTLLLEKPYGNRVPLLYGKKCLFNKLAYYIISTDPKAKERDSKKCLGKLRAIGDKDKFTLFDTGENFTKKISSTRQQLRCEHGSFMYRYEPCNLGNIRKMLVIIPSIIPLGLS